MHFKIFLKKSNRKSNKIWVDKTSEFYNNFFKKWLQYSDIVMYSTHNKGKYVAAERFTIKEQDLQTHDFNIKKCVY